MSRRKQLAKAAQKRQWLKPETKESIIAILLFCLAVILMLARFKKAGPVGDFIYAGLAQFFGWGYYLIPFISLVIGALFLISQQKKLVGVTFLGASFFVISGLGLIDIILPERGGILGKLAGSLEIPFGYTAAIILTMTFIVAALLVTLNASLRLKLRHSAEESAQEEPQEIEEITITEPKTQTAKDDNKPAFAKASAGKEEKNEEEIVVAESRAPVKTRNVRFKTGDYIAPPLSLLKSSVEKPTAGDLRANANIIKRTLESFGMPVEMGEISIGPKVTRYTLKPAEGIKLSRITALNQDLSLALAAHPIRIEAPIPGKSLVGIEVPNKSAAIVRLGSLLAYQDFTNSSPLSLIIGRDVTGEPIIADIEKMPHLLIAGATGSGKSVAVHSMIISLLYKNSPATLRMILIDPKRVELSVYDGIPHLISPVITDGKKAIGALRWAIQEMERRYEILLEAGARDIKSYNKSQSSISGPMPYLLLVIDELADLMATYGREIESSVVRLAQMARATGIHLVVSTQRPSVEVITGLIKANITSRIALQVASQVDSRTILDMAGAEKLLGGGDMLFISYEFSKPKRIQGAYISEEETKKVADFVKDNNETLLDESSEIENAASTEPNFENFSNDNADDELFDEAVRIIREAGKASASFLQRRLKIGYARAARLLDIMEAKGIIGPGDGAKPREVFGVENKNDNLDEGQFM